MKEEMISAWVIIAVKYVKCEKLNIIFEIILM